MLLRRCPRLVPQEIAHSRRAASSGSERKKALSMTTLNHSVKTDATPIGSDGAIQSAPMSEKLIRLERLIAVLDARDVPRDARSRYLFERGGDTSFSYWSTLVHGGKSFGAVTARRIEHMLELAPFSLEENGLPPDAASIAGAFNALPVTTPEELTRRQTIYTSIMAMLQAHGATGPNSL
jgi:hypothetical protein